MFQNEEQILVFRIWHLRNFLSYLQETAWIYRNRSKKLISIIIQAHVELKQEVG